MMTRNITTASIIIASAIIISIAAIISPISVAAVITPVVHDPGVPLSHCMRFGPLDRYQFEWAIDAAASRTLQMRFTAEVQRGFTSFGFTHQDKVQLISANPPESLPCARRLYDNYSPYNLVGDVYPSYPEVPANEITSNLTHVSHYVMRNLSTTAKQMLDHGGSLGTSVTLMWGFGLASMYSQACYNLNMSGLTEFAQLNVTFTDSAYLKGPNGTACPRYNGTLAQFRGLPPLKAPPAALLDSELNENTRMAGLLIGGDMLLQTGQGGPAYTAPPGFVEAGENYANACQSSRNTLRMRWSGFTDVVGGVQRYEITAGTPAKPSLYLDRASAGTNLAFTFSGLTLDKNATLKISFDAINFAGLATTVALPDMHILNNNNPVFGRVLDGTVAETLDATVVWQFVRSTTRLSAHWRDYLLHDHNSLNSTTMVFTELGYEYAIGIAGQAPGSFLGYTAVGAFETEKVLTGLTLAHGTKYYWTIRTTNCAGVQVLAHSPGVTVDVVSPGRGRVFFSNTTFRHNAVVKRSGRLAVTWAGFTDTTSGIALYEFAVGKTPMPADGASNLDLIVNWTSAGTGLRSPAGVAPTIYSLPPATQALVPLGTLLYAYVKATDRAGNWAVAASNATTVVAE